MSCGGVPAEGVGRENPLDNGIFIVVVFFVHFVIDVFKDFR